MNNDMSNSDHNYGMIGVSSLHQSNHRRRKDDGLGGGAGSTSSVCVSSGVIPSSSPSFASLDSTSSHTMRMVSKVPSNNQLLSGRPLSSLHHYSHHRYRLRSHAATDINDKCRNLFFICFASAICAGIVMIQINWMEKDLPLTFTANPTESDIEPSSSSLSYVGKDKGSIMPAAPQSSTGAASAAAAAYHDNVPIAAAVPDLETKTNVVEVNNDKAGVTIISKIVDTTNSRSDVDNASTDNDSTQTSLNQSVLPSSSSSSAAAATTRTTLIDNRLPSSSSTNDTHIDVKTSQPPQTSLLPWSNVTTLSFKEGYLYSGFRNQIQVFTSLVMEAVRQGFGQILVESISMKDLHGTNKQAPFHDLWDVEHWNSYYPRLPRLVLSDPILHDQFNPRSRTPYPKTKDGNWTDINGNVIEGYPTRPVYYGLQSKLMRQYWGYMKGREPYAMPDGTPNPVDQLILGGALRPHPTLQALVDKKLELMQMEMEQSNNKSTAKTMKKTTTAQESKAHPMEYMALHARIEADMQKHRVCRDKKVLNLTDIISSLEQQFPDPPAKALFLPINRKILEKEGYPNENEPEKTNWIAVGNLRAYNDILEHGLWNGTVKVFQMGTTGLEGTKFENRSSIAGSLLDYFIALESKVFIGTPVSSFSHALMATRFYRQEYNNWQYLPDGLHLWTPPPPSSSSLSDEDDIAETEVSSKHEKRNQVKKVAPPFGC